MAAKLAALYVLANTDVPLTTEADRPPTRPQPSLIPPAPKRDGGWELAEWPRWRSARLGNAVNIDFVQEVVILLRLCGPLPLLCGVTRAPPLLL